MTEIRCYGCGAIIQSADTKKPGYVPESALSKEKILCQRCYKLMHYHQKMESHLTKDDFLRVLQTVGEKDCLVVYIVDLFDFNGSLVPGLMRHIGYNDVLVLANKRDILPKSLKEHRLNTWVRRQFKEYGIKPLDVVVTSGKKNMNFDEIFDKIDEYRHGRDVYVVGITNVGKSTFINRMLKNYSDTTNLITTSEFPGTTLTYFLALIAFACLSGVYLSIHSTVQLQANLSALGERRSITPTHKLSLILGDLLVLESIHFVNILILELYLTQVLHISLGHDIPKLLLITFMGTLIGICLGILIGCAGKLSYSVKSGIGVLVTLLPSFLAGLMFGGMKNVIEQHCPVINRINPASVLSDAFYCLSVYDDAVRYRRCILILVIMCLLCISFSFLMIRRERYDSI